MPFCCAVQGIFWMGSSSCDRGLRLPVFFVLINVMMMDRSLDDWLDNRESELAGRPGRLITHPIPLKKKHKIPICAVAEWMWPVSECHTVGAPSQHKMEILRASVRIMISAMPSSLQYQPTATTTTHRHYPRHYPRHYRWLLILTSPDFIHDIYLLYSLSFVLI